MALITVLAGIGLETKTWLSCRSPLLGVIPREVNLALAAFPLPLYTVRCNPCAILLALKRCRLLLVLLHSCQRKVALDATRHKRTILPARLSAISLNFRLPVSSSSDRRASPFERQWAKSRTHVAQDLTPRVLELRHLAKRTTQRFQGIYVAGGVDHRRCLAQVLAQHVRRLPARQQYTCFFGIATALLGI